MTTIEKIAKDLGIDKSVVRAVIEAYTCTRKKDKGAKAKSPYANIKGGYKADLGVSCRSNWEAGVLRWLSFNDVVWQYEPRTFYFEGKRGRAGMYTPDIYLPKYDQWIEIKGYLRKGDQLKIRRFRDFYPEEFKKLHVIVKNNKVKAAKFFAKMNIPVFIYYKDLERMSDEIPNWE